jgi:hypothetical protein
MIVYLDVETVPAQRPEVVSWMAARALAKGTEPKSADKEYRASSLSPLLGELAVVSLALDDNEPLTWKRDFADPQGEARLCEAVAFELGALYDDGCLSQIVAHNAEFDRTMLRTRCAVHGVKLPYKVHALRIKPWDSVWICTMEMLRADWKSYASLDAACVAFGVPLLKGDIDGSKVWDAICEGRLDDVASYCADDVRRVRAVYKKLMAVTR